MNYYDAALTVAKELTEWSLKIENPKHRFFICSGGGPGIMEAANRGASEASGESIGLGISLPHEQSNNAYVSDDLSFEFHYFFHPEILVPLPCQEFCDLPRRLRNLRRNV